jgi:hypothetical protein
MPRPSRRIRTSIVASAGVVVAAGLAVPTIANARPAASTTSAESVTILLKAPHPTALRDLAAAHGLTHAQRIAELDRILPTTAAHDQVTTALRDTGFTVTDQTAWTITAKAAAPTVASAFGTLTPVAANASPLDRVRERSALPRVPASISSVVAVALPSSGGASLLSPLACDQCLSGTTFRDAYTAPHVTPTTGSDTKGPLTIATLQFGGWNPSDLTKYATSIGVPDPLTNLNGNANGHDQYTQIPVGQPTVPAASVSEHGADEEVDLDQETILSTDPSANQRAYFSPTSSGTSYVQDLARVFADVTQGSGHSSDGGDPKIAALSTSWGSCEAEFELAFNGATFGAVENVLTSLTAAGVTVFAASGDDGVYDCGNSATSTKIAVDYPASSPEVIGVGGTTLRAIGGVAAPNTGSNWNESVWSCTSAQVCQGDAANDTGGSGGGESSLARFPLPAYQKAGIASQRFTTSTGKTGNFGTQPRRLVPDIAAVGDPATGFGVLTTDPVDACANSIDPSTCRHDPPATTFEIGGTSLSSPASAALFTDMLGAHEASAGVGDIHGALYSAYAAHNGSFRDVTRGSNGLQANVDSHAKSGTAAELPVTAQKGYDALSGLGAPLWPKIAPFIFSPQVPTGHRTLVLTSPHSAKHADTLRARWSASQVDTDGSAAAKAMVTITRKGTSKPVFHSTDAAAAGSHTFTAPPGDYLLTVTETDLAGQHSKPVTATATVPYDDTSFAFHGAWTRTKSASSFAGSRAVTSAHGAYAKTTRYGRTFSLLVGTGPRFGKLAVYHGSRKIGTYDLYSRKSAQAMVTFYGTVKTRAKQRTFTFRYTGAKNKAAAAKTIDVDGLYVVR